MGTVDDPGFSAGSHAHQHAALVMKILDTIAVKLTETGKPVPIAEDQLSAEILKAFDSVQAQRIAEQTLDDSPYVDLPGSRVQVPELYVAKH